MKKAHTVAVCWLTLIALALTVPRIVAQDDMPPAAHIIEGVEIADFQWLPDSSGLWVIDEVLPSERRIEFEYVLDTQLTRSSSNLLETEGTSGKTSSLVYLSPDKQWSVYGVVEEKQEYLVLRNRLSGELHVMYEAPLIIITYSPLFNVRWSEDSSAFYVYTTNGPTTFWYYVSSFTDGLENARVVALHKEKGEFQDAVKGFREVLDIDSRGDFLLIERSIRVDNTLTNELIILSTSDYSYETLVVTHHIIAASFGIGEIFYIASDGMSVYDLEKGVSYLLNPYISSSSVQTPEISPDGRYIAAITSGNNHSLSIIPTGLDQK